MGISKVTLDGSTLIDLSSVTVTESHLDENILAHNNCGDIIEGVGRPFAYEDLVLKHTYSGAYENSQIRTFGNRSFMGNTVITSVNAPNVTSVGYAAFNGCTSLASFSAPNVTRIDGYGFYGCTNLTSFSMPNVTVVNSYGFYGCSKLATPVNFPDCATVSTYAFYGCSKIPSVNLPKVTTLGSESQHTFRACTSLTAVSMPSLTAMADYTFQGDTNLADVYLPKATYIGAYSFQNVKKLVNGVFPNAYVVYTASFEGATGLKTLDLGHTATPGSTLGFIRTNGMKSCSALDTIVIRHKSKVYALSYTTVFDGTPFASSGTGGTLYVPQALITSYEAATNWSTFLAYENNSILPIEGSPYEHFYTDGSPIITTSFANGVISTYTPYTKLNGTYFAKLVPDIGYEISTVSVKMNNIDITQEVYNTTTKEINIPNVTAYVDINIVATAINYDWDHEWSYTDGMPTENGWTQTNWNTGATATMTESGLVLTSKSSTNVTFRRNDFLVDSGVIEVTLSATYQTSTAHENAVVSLSNGTYGIVLMSSKGVATLKTADSIANCTSLGVTLPSNTDFVVRIAIDGMKGNISINGNVIWKTNDISTATYSGTDWKSRTSFASQSQQSGYSTIVKSARLKRLSGETI